MTVTHDTILDLKGVSKVFPGVTALQRVSLAVNRGETHILLGENGAGKSSLIKLLAGIYQPDEGEIEFDGKPYHPRAPHDAFHAGVRVVHQELNLLPHLSVAENLLLERLPQRHGLVDYARMKRRAVALLGEVGLDIAPSIRVDRLGIAQMQLVEIAKALCYESKLLVLDEPTATLTPREIDRLFGIIRQLKSKGVTLIYISHRLHEIYKIGDRVTVLRNGQVVATQPIAALAVGDIMRMMVGRDIREEYVFREDVATGDPVLRVEGLKRRASSPEVSFSVRSGEIVGVAGLVGSGRTGTMRAVFGADRKSAGIIHLGETPCDINSPRDAVQQGLCLLTEDRKSQGLLLDMPCDENITIADLAKVSRLGLLRRSAERNAARRLVRELRVKTPSIRQMVRNLSGGNQQKIVIAKWLFRGSTALIFDEPTRGIDVGAKREIYQLLWDLAAAGKGILVVSSDLPELIGISHRILVFSKGKIVGDIPRAEFEQERILSLAYQEYLRQ